MYVGIYLLLEGLMSQKSLPSLYVFDAFIDGQINLSKHENKSTY